MLERGPYPHLRGTVLRQQTGNATTGAFAEAAVGDWDGDGDEDLIVGSGYGDLLYFERRTDGFLAEPVQMMPEPLSLLSEPLEARPVSPAMADWDGDGRLDLVLGLGGNVYLCRRTDDGVAPPVELKAGTHGLGALVKSVAPNCGHLAPCVADVDLDGDLDLLLGDDKGQVWWVAGEGKGVGPRLSRPGRVVVGGRALNVGIRARVAVGDWNADGYPDVFVGTANGTLSLCAGSSTGPQAPRAFYGIGSPTGAPDTTSLRDISPVFSHWYGAARGPRLLLGDRRGFVGLLTRGEGDQCRLEGYVQGVHAPIDTGRCAAPCPADWDGDGDLDLVVGGEDGYVQMYERVASDPPLFKSGRRVVGKGGPIRAQVRSGLHEHLRYAWPCVADFDRDGDLDVLLGQANGRVAMWLNRRGLAYAGEIAVAGKVLTLSGLTTVAALDYDRDGDTDAFVGTRLIPGSTVASQLWPETVVYLENVAPKKGEPPLFVKAVRMDAFLVPPDGGRGTRDADILRISSMQPTHWDRDGVLDFLLGTRFGAYVFRTNSSRSSYPRLELRTSATGIPLPKLPPAWRHVAARLTRRDQGVICGMEECGWVAWYDRKALLNAE